MSKRIAALALGGVLTLAVATACTTEETVQVLPGGVGAQGISVTGTGKVSGSPDVALLSLGVSVEERTAKDARDKAAEAMDGVISSLKENGVESKDIQTQQFSIYPQFDYIDGRQQLRGFQVNNTVAARLRDLDRVGEAIDDAAGAGGDLVQIHSLSFTIDDPTELRAQAREEAVADAREKAERLAQLAGVKLGKPISISEEGFFQPPPAPFTGGALAEEARMVTPIETGELEVSLTVSVLFAID